MSSTNYVSETESLLMSARYSLIAATMVVDDNEASDELGRVADELWNIEQRLAEVLVAGDSR
ncbi:hypothetical protein [Halorubrum ezzemoulense]|uniref:hypothetical protein n=1 Tax=Halorubrum ezzemoulense TaxID=337243 RepID=UPI00233061AF|nr:hypothetical protein [Halorubrum ezzemoulense]MDB2237036.1 hypothetical protein [Halorubrum ezzemoulense]